MKKINYTISGFNALPMAADLTIPVDLSNIKGLVIYAHGINGFKDWGGMNKIAQEFSKQDWAFLKFNFSHNGTTPTHLEEFYNLAAYAQDTYLKRQFDLAQIFTFVDDILERDLGPAFKKIVLIGHSRGGADVILNAPENARLNGLITWASVAHAKTPWSNLDPDEIDQWREKGVFYRPNSRTKQDLPIGFELFEEWQNNKATLDIETSARKIEIPWLIAHGDEDEAVFVKDAYTLKECNPQAKVAIIEGANHTFGRVHPFKGDALPAHSQQLLAACFNFLAAL